MSHSAAPKTLETLRRFKFERILNDDSLTHTVILLGTLPEPEGDGEVQAIVRIEKTALNANQMPSIFHSLSGIDRTELEQSTDIYTWMFGWLGPGREGDVKINVICPATEVHIRKYTKQEQLIVRETPELYDKIVKPYIDAFPASRTQWVENILTGVSEKEKVLVSNPDFMILPDMKWDMKTLSSLYLLAIGQDRNIRSLRNLRKCHIGLLQSIRNEAEQVARQKWGLGKGSLRMFIHYQPSYYHFHVHIVNANYEGLLGMTVGQAHLLDDVISLLEIDNEENVGIFQKMTLTYGIGDQHGLYKELKAALV
ncbi:m7GpppX diphosphatase [Leucoagaricus sp. SymC.cos]|nr:m7GpppX diphosphatase [Leucoagaricus sp. SymC.cos]